MTLCLPGYGPRVWDTCRPGGRALSAASTISDIATVASAAVLGWPSVASVIVGARNRSHLPANLAISNLALTAEDRARIDLALANSQELEGDVFGLERDTTGRHGSIMKYNLTKGAA